MVAARFTGSLSHRPADPLSRRPHAGPAGVAMKKAWVMLHGPTQGQFPYHVRRLCTARDVPGLVVSEMVLWAQEQLGPCGVRWDVSYAVYHHVQVIAMLWLASEEDHVLARMVWS